MILGALLSACSYADPIFECEQEDQSVAESQNGKFTAAVVLVQCGATTSDATWVLLTPAGRKPNSDLDKVAVFEGKDVRISWSEGALTVSHGDLRSFKTESSLYGVKVHYKKLD